LTVAETTVRSEVLAAPAIPPTGITSAEEAEAGASMDVDVKSSKKAERKRKKKEEKAAKRAKKEKKSKGDSDSSD
jgi:H/ACA ribonucleoprotein complex subunit 4